jgi:hypothetical protein
MSTIGKRVIWVGPADGANDKPLCSEAVATAATLPGTTLSRSSAGFAPNAAAATVFGQLWLVADKDQMRSRSVDTAWAINENMVAIQPRSGESVNALVATGQALSVGTALTRNGAGLLVIALTDGTNEIVAYSDEAVTTTATQLVRVKKA